MRLFKAKLMEQSIRKVSAFMELFHILKGNFQVQFFPGQNLIFPLCITRAFRHTLKSSRSCVFGPRPQSLWRLQCTNKAHIQIDQPVGLPERPFVWNRGKYFRCI